MTLDISCTKMPAQKESPIAAFPHKHGVDDESLHAIGAGTSACLFDQ